MVDGSDSIWTLQDGVGRLASHALSCKLDVANPDGGLNDVDFRSVSLHGTVLSVQQDIDGRWPATLSDAYVRGNDLVASYSAANDWPFAPQIYWRGDTLDGVTSLVASLGVLISVQTHLLDTFPDIRVTTRLAAEEFFDVGLRAEEDGQPMAVRIEERVVLRATASSRCILWRLRDANASYLETMPGSDFREVIVERRDDGTCQARWRVFADFLEKGVIRRARLQAAFLPRENDLERATEYCRALERRPLPLTA